MSTQIYPGQGLSLSQLVFALNEQLKRTAYSPSFTFDQVSQLDQDTSNALAVIREWRNSFVCINRIPLEILSLISTHLPSQKDRFRASFICRRWRRTLLQLAELWSHLFLSETRGEGYVTTLLERAKRSALDLSLGFGVPADLMALLSSHTEQIRSLDFVFAGWEDVERFAGINSGPLPLLRTLTINAIDDGNLGEPHPSITPSRPLFGQAVNLKEFRFQSQWGWPPSLNNFAFPRLVSFDLLTTGIDGFRATQLLDFLEASPMLRTVRIKVTAFTALNRIPQERVATLPQVGTFDLTVDDGAPSYEIATHISCPSARDTSFKQFVGADDVVLEEIFPTLDSWNAIVHQYARSPVEDVTLEIKTVHTIACTLTFRSSDSNRLVFGVTVNPEKHVPLPDGMYVQVLAQAVRTILDHPHLTHTKRLSICHNFCGPDSTRVLQIANEVGPLLRYFSRLDELNIYHCDLRPYFRPFLASPVREPVVFPHIRKLSILHPSDLTNPRCVAAITRLAKFQHQAKAPIEQVVIKNEKMPVGMEEELSPLVGSVEHVEMVNHWF